MLLLRRVRDMRESFRKKNGGEVGGEYPKQKLTFLSPLVGAKPYIRPPGQKRTMVGEDFISSRTEQKQTTVGEESPLPHAGRYARKALPSKGSWRVSA